jgi:hypothetical protein
MDGWCDTGFQNLVAATHTTSLGWIDGNGVMETASAKTFTLESFVATSAWAFDQPWFVISYAENNGSLTEKGPMEISPTFSKAETFKFKGKDWAGIAAVAFSLVSFSQDGNTCTYGTYGYGYGQFGMCLDHLKVKFAKKADLKHDGGNLPTPYQLHHRQHNAAHVAAVSQAAHDISAAHSNDSNSPHHQTDNGYHTQLLSLGNDTGMTGQFHLPSVEHFA